MGTFQRFEDLAVWQSARSLAKKISIVVRKLRFLKEFRLADQMSGSSGSIMDNIAEGFERNSRLEFINSLGIAKGETGELRSQLYRCLDAQHISETEFNELCLDTVSISKQLGSFIVYLNRSEVKGLKFKDRRT